MTDKPGEISVINRHGNQIITIRASKGIYKRKK